MKKLLLLTILLSTMVFTGCEKMDTSDPEMLHQSVKQLTDVIVHDIFSPPVASRIYAYASIAGYEAMAASKVEGYQSLAKQLNGLTNVPQPDNSQEYDFHLASIHAFLTVGKALIFSESMIEEYQDEIYKKYKSATGRTTFDNSIAYGDEVAQHILAWADKDNYKQTRTFPKYTITVDPARWQPTPPDYMEGIEPHWNKIRTFVIDSSSQFTPAPPTSYDMDDTTGQFYKEVMEVYEVVSNLSEEEKAIAKFWDCNPYVSHHEGHAMFATKKITPGGHWVNIAAIAARQSDANFMQAAETYALTCISLADAFISCWDEKYRSNLVRPETVINTHIDPDWAPTLQTPPFPEYTSGHSVISAAASVALTKLYGETFEFVDDSEEEYGLPSRSFKSFYEASEEAAVSRLYGGIHYRPACDIGVTQGRKLGGFIMENISTKSDGGISQINNQ